MSHKSLIHQREEKKLQPFLCSSIGSSISQKKRHSPITKKQKKRVKEKEKLLPLWCSSFSS